MLAGKTLNKLYVQYFATLCKLIEQKHAWFYAVSQKQDTKTTFMNSCH